MVATNETKDMQSWLTRRGSYREARAVTASRVMAAVRALDVLGIEPSDLPNDARVRIDSAANYVLAKAQRTIDEIHRVLESLERS